MSVADASPRRRITNREGRTLLRLEDAAWHADQDALRARKKWRRYTEKLNQQLGCFGMSAHDLFIEWMVPHLNPTQQEDTMVTRASGSQSTQHAPKAGQNKPISGGASGAGKARGGASLPNITKTTAPKLPTKR